LKVLLDTNAVLWAALYPDRLSAAATAIIADTKTKLLVSAATAWEIATKVRVGKLPEAVKLEQNFLETARQAGYELLPISPEVALRAGRLVGIHRDPFDRMIGAQALALDIPVISSDNDLDQFAVLRIW
jgi:PIN domain nuclease of toxin-antitoxin system